MKKETMILAGLGAVMALSLAEAVTTLAAETGWTSVDGVWRYVDSSGNYAANVWKNSGNDSFYLDGDDVMEIDDTYYVNENGALVKNAWVQVTEEEGPRSRPGGWGEPACDLLPRRVRSEVTGGFIYNESGRMTGLQ